ncbi:hypothetical protein F5X99DRAFT_428843 [Biscogniauxia marginata]|nr:hypothetical protein F5X99DRAFT_428843 [Biscogniauxia marginata]
MAHILPHPSRERLMLAAARETDAARRHALLRELTEGHGSVADLPVIFFVEDLMDMYPGGAAVVLNRRRESFGFFFSSWRFRLAGLPFATDRLWYALNVAATGFGARRFGTPDCFCVAAYEVHNARVREEARRRGREVLDFVLEMGWAPLCEFLGAEVPDEPFSRLNERRTFQVIGAIFIAKGLLAYAASGAGLWASWRYGPLISGFVRNWGRLLLR